MRKIQVSFALSAILTVLIVDPVGGIEIAKDGVSKVTIVAAKGSSLPVRHAAKELKAITLPLNTKLHLFAISPVK